MLKKNIEKIIDRFVNFRAYSAERAQYFAGLPEARYNFASQFAKGKKILDVGCSLGCGAFYLAERGAAKVVGVDYSPAAISEARRNYIHPNLNFDVLSAGDLAALNSPFDLIVAFEIVEHLEEAETENFLRGAAKVLRGGGIFLLSTPNKLVCSPGCEKPPNPYHVKEYLPDELEQLLKKYFRDVKLLGMKCVNSGYLKKERELVEKSFRYRVLKNMGRSRKIRSLAAFVPMKYRQKITGEDKLPPLVIEDFRLTDAEVGMAETLLATCRK